MLISVSSSAHAFSISFGTEFDHYTGGNPSAEEVEEALAEGAEQVNNVVHSFRLQSTSFDKKVSHHYLHTYWAGETYYSFTKMRRGSPTHFLSDPRRHSETGLGI